MIQTSHFYFVFLPMMQALQKLTVMTYCGFAYLDFFTTATVRKWKRELKKTSLKWTVFKRKHNI